MLERLADGFAARPVPYMLAIVCAVVAALYRQLHAAQKERIKELKAERDAAAAEVKQVRREHMDALVDLATTAKALTGLNEKVQREASELERARAEHERKRGVKRMPREPATLVAPELK